MMFDERSARSDDEREALEFLRRGRSLRGLSAIQFRRIENHVARATSLRRNRRWLPALAALGLLLVAGGALAHIMDLSRLPFIGPLFPTHQDSRTLPTPHSRRHSLRASPGTAGPVGVSPAPPPPVVPAALVGGSAVEQRPTAESAESPPAPPARAHTASAAGRSLSRPAHVSEPSREPGETVAALPILVQPRTQDRRAEVVANAEPVPVSGAVRARTPNSQPGIADLEPAPPAWARGAALLPSPGGARARPTEDPVLSESQSLSAAVAQWHRDHNASAVLAALDDHERRFPGGQMQLETNLLRAEILLQQGREREGLTLLDRMVLPGLPRGRELQTVRGELRIKYGRCLDGRRDLDHVLAKDRTDDLARRAERALTLCP